MIIIRSRIDELNQADHSDCTKPMSETPSKFDSAVWDIVAHIPPGRVMGYGEVARAAGFPRHARMVSKAMGRCPTPLPWYRVIRSNRTLAFPVDSDAYRRQKELLEKEDVSVVNGKVIATTIPPDDLDRLLWGPPDG